MMDGVPFPLGAWLPAHDDDEALVLRELFGASSTPLTDLPDPGDWPCSSSSVPDADAWSALGWDAQAACLWQPAEPLPADLLFASWLASAPPMLDAYASERALDLAPASQALGASEPWPLPSLFCLDYVPCVEPGHEPVPPGPAADGVAVLDAYTPHAADEASAARCPLAWAPHTDWLGLDGPGPWAAEGGAT